MNFFRDDEALATLSTDDRVEVFLQILPGDSDITTELLERLLRDYCAGDSIGSENEPIPRSSSDH